MAQLCLGARAHPRSACRASSSGVRLACLGILKAHCSSPTYITTPRTIRTGEGPLRTTPPSHAVSNLISTAREATNVGRRDRGGLCPTLLRHFGQQHRRTRRSICTLGGMSGRAGKIASKRSGLCGRYMRMLLGYVVGNWGGRYRWSRDALPSEAVRVHSSFVSQLLLL